MKMTSNIIRHVMRRTFASQPSGVTKTSAFDAHCYVPTKEKPLMDLLPIPEGPWEDYHRKQNAKYNIHLISGMLFCGVSLAYLYYKDVLFMNSLPPLPDQK